MSNVINTEELLKKTPQSYKGEVPLPNNVRFIIRCISEEFGPSKSSDNPMITLEWEVVAPESIPVGDKLLTVAGIKLRQYLSTKIFDRETREIDQEKTDKAQTRWVEQNKLLGLPISDLNPENPVKRYENVVADAMLYCKEEALFDAPTPKDIAGGAKVGKKIGSKWVPNIGRILGASTTNTNTPY
jgi:hypothetical protein